MDLALSSVVSLLGAFFGSVFGVYLAFIKTKKERLWADRYDVLRDTILNLDVVQSYFEATYMDLYGIKVNVEKKRERLENDLTNAQHELRQNIAKLRLLFKEKDIKKVTALYFELNVVFYEFDQSTPPEQAEEGCDTIIKKATQMIEEVIKVAQRYSL